MCEFILILHTWNIRLKMENKPLHGLSECVYIYILPQGENYTDKLI